MTGTKCTHCSHPLYAGTKCKNCGRVDQPAQQEPVAWIAKQEDGGLLLWDASYKHIQEGYDLGFNKSKRIKYYPLYLHPAHDDTALLREALEWFDAMRVGAMSRNNAEQLADEVSAALRERLVEKV